MALTKITNDLLDLGSDTGALGLPKGTEAQRPSNPVEGTLRHNSEIDETKLETYNGTEWRKINELIPAYSVDYLVVAGGGGANAVSTGGRSYGSGGGGGGGLRTSFGNNSGGGAASETPLMLKPGTEYNVIVGAGGAGADTSSSRGGDSSIGLINCIGGGSSSLFAVYADGGSGCGAMGLETNDYPGGFPGTGTLGQGYDGGSAGGISGANYGAGGGGGGAAGQGSNGLGPRAAGGAGGAGLVVSITSNSVSYSEGGNGGPSNIDFAGSNAQNNTGNGANAPGVVDGGAIAGKNGGSGIVILRMSTASYSGTTTGTPTVTTDGTDTILTYTSSGTYTA